MPNADETVVGIMAVIAQGEREMIAERTKAALGCRDGARPTGSASRRAIKIPDRQTRARGTAATKANAVAFAERLRPVLAELTGLPALATAAELDRRGIATARGGKWAARSIIELRARLDRGA